VGPNLDPFPSPACLYVLIVWSALASACGGGTPTAPSPDGPVSYEGQWSGTTAQGRAISFTVSPGPKITALAVGYSFGGCSGTQTFTDLSLDIGSPPNSIRPSVGAAFGFGSGPPDGANYTQVYGSFTSSSAATGTVTFLGYACGNTVAAWSATKR
jgi:hypothetical protein